MRVGVMHHTLYNYVQVSGTITIGLSLSKPECSIISDMNLRLHPLGTLEAFSITYWYRPTCTSGTSGTSHDGTLAKWINRAVKKG